jgi:hypothetical protein
MSFLNPLFLLGLAALAAPVLVHLVRRTRARRVEFPALYFVRQVPQRTIRRRTLHNLLLLLLRCLAILLVVLAFTRPFFSGANAARESDKGRASIILVDASLSMRHGERFDEAKRRAETILGEAQADEQVALLSFGESFEVLSRFTDEKNNVRTALNRATVGYEATDYEQALRGAEALFADVKTDGLKRVFLISDFQSTGWNSTNATFKLSSDLRLVPIDVGGAEQPANIAITNVEARGAVYGQKYADKMAVHVSNFSDEARDRVMLNFQINDQTVEKREVALAARDSKVVEFTGFNLAEGANRCLIDLQSDDFPHDNRFYFTLHGEPAAKALIVESGARGRGESFYLQNALATGDNLPFNFTVRSANAVDPASIPEQSLVILNDAGSLPARAVDALTSFVEAGGRMIIASGPQTRPETFNQSFARISPANLREIVEFRRGESVAMTDVKMSHPVFEIFRGSGRLASARVFGYQRAEPRENAAVLARYEDGSPAFVEGAVGENGRVLLFTSTLGMSWNDLALTPTYLPLVQQMVRYLGEREVTAWHRLGQTFAVGKESSGAAPAIDSPAGVRIKSSGLTPSGETLVTAREPGFYRLRYEARPDFAAVNVSGREGDFSKLNMEEFLATIAGGHGALAAGDEAGDLATAQEIEARQRVWWPLLALALILFATEAVLARRTKMVKMIG